MSKTLKERNCYLVIEPNDAVGCWNGYLVKDDKTYWGDGYIKAFLYDTPEECYDAATAWANNHPKELRNYKSKKKDNR